jgi:hypothetical protein
VEGDCENGVDEGEESEIYLFLNSLGLGLHDLFDDALFSRTSIDQKEGESVFENAGLSRDPWKIYDGARIDGLWISIGTWKSVFCSSTGLWTWNESESSVVAPNKPFGQEVVRPRAIEVF